MNNDKTSSHRKLLFNKSMGEIAVVGAPIQSSGQGFPLDQAGQTRNMTRDCLTLTL
jgi:hypothetical protein